MKHLEDKYGIEDQVYYSQNLNIALARINESKSPGSVFIVQLSEPNGEEGSCFQRSLEKITEYDFDNTGRIRKPDYEYPLFVSHNLKDTEDNLKKTIESLTNDFSQIYDNKNNDKFKVAGFVYDGAEKMTAEQAIEKAISLLEK